MFSRFTYVFREMWASLSRNLTLTVAAIITATVSLFLSGLTLLIQKGFDNQLADWTQDVRLLVYIDNDATPEQIKVVQDALDSDKTVVESSTFCDVVCSYDVAKKLYAATPEALDRLDETTIPSFFRVVPTNKDNAQLLTQVKAKLKGLPKVQSVKAPDEVIDPIGGLKNFVGFRSLVMSIVLLLAAVLLIWNSIRTAMFARRREIEVMKLVGATNWFIRLPFMLEGLIQGLVGGVIGGSALLLVNSDWTEGMRNRFGKGIGLSGFVVEGSTPWAIAMAMVALGAVVGAIGSATAASRFLDV